MKPVPSWADPATCLGTECLSRVLADGDTDELIQALGRVRYGAIGPGF